MEKKMETTIQGSGFGVHPKPATLNPNPETPKVKDFKFVPLMCVPRSFGSQIPLLRAIFHGLGTQNPRVQTLRVQRETP